MTRPLIAITMGDPAGIGPEIIVKCLAKEAAHKVCRPLVVGSLGRLKDAAKRSGINPPIVAAGNLDNVNIPSGTVACVDLDLVPADMPYGEVQQAAGEAAYRYIEKAVRLAQAGTVGAICTAPLSKEALHLAGHKFPGHTELIAQLTDTPEVSMMLACPKLRVIHVTTHVGLLDAIERIEPGRVFRTIERGRSALLDIGIREPRIGVCAINPHAGENGLFGRGEEAAKITPAIERCTALGWDVRGPMAADTLFFVAARGDFDLVVAMYHDQGHGPVKVLGLDAGVNVSVGLPIIRTSVDHGTAFDIAGTGVADEESLNAALAMAAEMAHGREKRLAAMPAL